MDAPNTQEELDSLAALLEERLQTIADQSWRERDPEGQLARLQEIGEAIFAAHDALKGHIPPRLEHFLAGCSYDKALAFIRAQKG